MNSQPLMKSEAVEIYSRPRDARLLDCENASFTPTSPAAEGAGIAIRTDAKTDAGRAKRQTPLNIDWILRDALAICQSIESGKPLTRLAMSRYDDNAFGMGHLLYNIMDKGFLRDPDMRPEDLVSIAARADDGSDWRRTGSRQRLISALKDADVLVPTPNDRDLKPAGTTPSLRVISGIVEDFILESENLHVSLEEIVSPSRVARLVKARFAAIWIMRHVCGHSLSLIGSHMGNRDHTTILSALNNTAIKAKADKGYAEELETLCEKADSMGVMQNRTLLKLQVS